MKVIVPVKRVLDFNVKARVKRIEIPVYSHALYDVMPDEKVVIEGPDLVILEGVVTLQAPVVRLLDAGIYVNVAVPPATPNGVSLLRCSLCAVHTTEQLEHMVEVITGIGRQLGVLSPTPKLRVVGGNR